MTNESYLAIASGIETTRADALLSILKERGRGFASDGESWAELRLMLEKIKTEIKAVEDVHKEMWSAVKERNADAYYALCQEFERSSAYLAGDWAWASVMAKIAMYSYIEDWPTREPDTEI